MRTLTRTTRVLVLLAVLLAVATIGACGGSMTPSVLAPTVATITTLPSTEEMLADKTLGSSSQNTIIEYVSFWCSACKDFYLTGDGAQMKTQFADTGKAQITFRNLFLTSETSFAAADLARCAGNARFFDAVDTIFRNQSSWLNAFDPDASVKSLMLGFGLSQSVVNACVGNSALENGLIQIHMNAMAATYQLPDGTTTVGFQYVPALVVNGVALDGRSEDNKPTLANIQKFLKPGT